MKKQDPKDYGKGDYALILGGLVDKSVWLITETIDEPTRRVYKVICIYGNTSSVLIGEKNGYWSPQPCIDDNTVILYKQKQLILRFNTPYDHPVDNESMNLFLEDT